MANSAWTLVVALLLGPGPGEVSPPAPTIDAPIEGPSEGPAEGPTPAPEPGIEFAPEPGIELATEPPEAEPGSDPSAPPVVEEEPSWPTPGTAPPDGYGWIVTGSILLPTAALATWALFREARTGPDQVGILVAGVGLGVVGAGLIGTGIYRHTKLKKWTLAYRVIAPPQGGGLIAAGSVAALFGATLIGVGSVAAARGYPNTGGTIIGVGIAGVAVIAPLTIYFGKKRRQKYIDTGGWYRPTLPTVHISPHPIVTHQTFGLALTGRF